MMENFLGAAIFLMILVGIVGGIVVLTLEVSARMRKHTQMRLEKKYQRTDKR